MTSPCCDAAVTSVDDVIVAEMTQLVTSLSVVVRHRRLSTMKHGVGRQPGGVEVGVVGGGHVTRGGVVGIHVARTGARRRDAHLAAVVPLQRQRTCRLIQTATEAPPPPYLSEHCIPVSSADTRRHLRSANHHLLAVPRFRLNTYGRRAFSVAGPTAWNSLPDFIWDPTSGTDCFRRLLKTYLFARY